MVSQPVFKTTVQPSSAKQQTASLTLLKTPTAASQKNALRNELLKTYTPYVKRIVNSLARRKSDPTEDLVQVGLMGLLKAIDYFEKDRLGPFKKYATFFITKEIRQYLRDSMTFIKPPKALVQLYYRLNQQVALLEKQLGRSPSQAELLEQLQWSAHQWQEVAQYERRKETIPLEQFLTAERAREKAYYEEMSEQAVTEDSSDWLLHTASDEDTDDAYLSIRCAIERLDPQQQQLIRLVYFEDKPQSDLARALGVSPMQINRRLKKALNQLQMALEL